MVLSPFLNFWHADFFKWLLYVNDNDFGPFIGPPTEICMSFERNFYTFSVPIEFHARGAEGVIQFRSGE
jgi:hypothetical protein